MWTASQKTPVLARLLGFDDGAGSVLGEDEKGGVVRVDLRRGDVTRDAATKLSNFVSADGSAAYGIGADGSVTRLTPAGSWTFKPPAPARDVIPQPDGTLLVLANRGLGTIVWLIHPPDDRIADSVLLPRVSKAIRTPAGDRVYFPVDSGLVGVRGRDLQIVPSIKLPRKPHAVVTSPSGDRIYVAADSSNELLVVDRYTGNVSAHVAIPVARAVAAHGSDRALRARARVRGRHGVRDLGEHRSHDRRGAHGVAPGSSGGRAERVARARSRKGCGARRRRDARDQARGGRRRGGRLDVHHAGTDFVRAPRASTSR